MYVLIFLLVLLSPGVAFAYLDPMTGGVILQVLIGALMGLVFTVKMWWKRFIGLFKKKSSEEPPSK